MGICVRRAAKEINKERPDLSQIRMVQAFAPIFIIFIKHPIFLLFYLLFFLACHVLSSVLFLNIGQTSACGGAWAMTPSKSSTFTHRFCGNLRKCAEFAEIEAGTRYLLFLFHTRYFQYSIYFYLLFYLAALPRRRPGWLQPPIFFISLRGRYF